MQRTLLFLLVAVLLGVSVQAQADDAPPTIVITESGEAKVMPTVGTLSFSQDIVLNLKQDDGKMLSTEEAREQLTEKVQKLTGDVKKSLVFAKSFTKNFAANVSFFPRYKQNDQRNTIVGYQAHANYSVAVTDLKRAQEITEAVMKSGVERVSPLSAQASGSSQELCEQDALQNAVRRARKRADTMAGLMGGNVERISRAVINPQGAPRMYMAKAMAESNANMYEPQESTCTVRVELTFIVK